MRPKMKRARRIGARRKRSAAQSTANHSVSSTTCSLVRQSTDMPSESAHQEEEGTESRSSESMSESTDKNHREKEATGSREGVSESAERDQNLHDVLAQDEFLSRFRVNASELLCNTYTTEHPLHHSHKGTITSSLCEDVHSLLDAQIDVLHNYLVSSGLHSTPAGDALIIDVVQCIFRNLWYKQTYFRDYFLKDFEACCAAANDFFRMIETTEDILSKFRRQYPHLVVIEQTPQNEHSMQEREPPQSGASGRDRAHASHKSDGAARAESVYAAETVRMLESELLSLYSADAVYASQFVHMFVFESVHESSIVSELFDTDWEEKFTNNEVALSLVRTMEDFLADLRGYLCNELLYKKGVDSLVSATVVFYVRCLLQKADRIRRQSYNKQTEKSSERNNLPFLFPARAIGRIHGDIQVFKSFFKSMVSKMPALGRVIEREFVVLVTIYECLSIAAGVSDVDSLSDFVIVLHKRIGRNSDFTRLLVCDLWLLTGPDGGEDVAFEAVASMEGELQKISCSVAEEEGMNQIVKSERNQVPGLELEVVIKEVYGDDKRLRHHRPFQPPRFSIPASSRDMVGALKFDFTQGIKGGKFPFSIKAEGSSVETERKNDDEIISLLKMHKQKWLPFGKREESAEEYPHQCADPAFDEERQPAANLPESSKEIHQYQADHESDEELQPPPNLPEVPEETPHRQADLVFDEEWQLTGNLPERRESSQRSVDPLRDEDNSAWPDTAAEI